MAGLEILYEDNHLLAIAKPAGLPTMGVEEGLPSAVVLARQYIKRRYAKPGNVYLGVVSRLDAPVTGVLLLARTSKAARRLTEQFRTRSVRKVYWALVENAVEPPEGELVDFMAKNEARQRMQVVGRQAPGAHEARLRYRRLKQFKGLSLLEIELQTGRKHQIRVQLAHREWPILGDRKYGGTRPFAAGIGLHCRRIEFAHPVGGRTIELEAALPESWSRFDP